MKKRRIIDLTEDDDLSGPLEESGSEQALFIQSKISAPIRERLKAHVDRIRKEVEKRYANETHRAWCMGEKVTPPPFVKWNAVVQIPYAHPLTWVQDYDNNDKAMAEKMRDLLTPPEWVFDKYSLKLELNGSSLQPWAKQLPDYISQDPDSVIDWKWLNECNLYLSKLHWEDLHMLLSYTWLGDTFANAVGATPEQVKDTIEDLHYRYYRNRGIKEPGYFHHVMWVQFAREFREHGVLKLAKKIYCPYPSEEFLNHVTRYLKFRSPPLPADLDLSSCHKIDVCIDLLDNYKKLPADIEFLLVNYLAGFLLDDYVSKVIQPRYKKELTALVMNAPRTTKQMTTYRGTKTEYFLTQPIRRYYRNPVFISSSLRPRHAAGFMEEKIPGTKKPRCCALVIHITPGSRCLPLFSFSNVKNNEAEIILPPGTFFYHDSIQIKQLARNNRLQAGLHEFGREIDCAGPSLEAKDKAKIAIVYAMTPPKRGLVRAHDPHHKYDED
eukprot:jgi/Mesvir1/19569/Mv08665-RA.1